MGASARGRDVVPAMSTLLCLGLGYTASHYVAAFGARFDRVIGTARTRDGADRMHSVGTVETLVFEGRADRRIADAIAACDAVLASAPPTGAADPVLAECFDLLAGASTLRSIVYLSTVGVYGNYDGAWVNETTAPKTTTTRGRARLAAEAAWQSLGERTGKSVAVLRLAGIYGPGRNALVQLTDGTAKCIVKPGQVFNRIHVADIAQVIDCAFARRASGLFNVSDDEPAPPQDVVRFAADLLGLPAPPDIPFAEAVKDLSPMAASFYADCRRAGNERIKRELGIALRFPTYREGLRALAAAGK
jgi:nucleoside-diphosphate-sugar epimerase